WERAIHVRGDADVASLLPGRRRARCVDLDGAAVGCLYDAAQDLPSWRSHPRPPHQGDAREDQDLRRRGAASSCGGGRGPPRYDAGDVPSGPAADPAEALRTEAPVTRETDRMARAAAEADRQGFGAVVVAPSPDLIYLAGYAPMPMERPTLL